MPLFDTDNRLRSDHCAANARDAQNLSMEGYVFRDIRANANHHPCPIELSRDDCIELESRIQSRDGYGLTPSGIDSDSGFRFPVGGSTHDRARQSLATRVFVCAPDMGRGGLDAHVESKLLLSGDAGTARVCAHRLAELSYNRFDPGVRRVSVQNIVQPFPGGQASRDISRSDAFMESRGYRKGAFLSTRQGAP